MEDADLSVNTWYLLLRALVTLENASQTRSGECSLLCKSCTITIPDIETAQPQIYRKNSGWRGWESLWSPSVSLTLHRTSHSFTVTLQAFADKSASFIQTTSNRTNLLATKAVEKWLSVQYPLCDKFHLSKSSSFKLPLANKFFLCERWLTGWSLTNL